VEEADMRIGVIGAGQVGATLARLFVAVGHDVAVANSRGPQTLRDLDHDLGDRGHADTAEGAARFGEVIVVAVPFGRYREVPVEPTAGKVVVDANNYYPARDGHIPELDEDRSTSSELLQEHLPQARVVKAFNAIRWDHLRDLARPGGQVVQYGVPISGDDEAAKRTVAELVRELGFEPVDAGSLAGGGRRHQPGAPVYTADLTATDLRAALQAGTGSGRPPEGR
jgi:hypothetical protein